MTTLLSLPRVAALSVVITVLMSSMAAAQTPVSAQSGAQLPPPEVAVAMGGASLDYSPVEWSHYLAAFTGRFHVTPRLAVEGEVAYLPGFCGSTCWRSGHHDLVGSFVLAGDLRPGRPPVLPYVVLGVGLMSEQDAEADKMFAVVFGFGTRISITRHLFVSPEMRAVAATHGHVRTSVAVGWRF